MTVFDTALDDIFDNEDAVADATYAPPAGSASAIRVIVGRGDVAGRLGSNPFQMSPANQANAVWLSVRKSELALPVKGGTVVFEGRTYTVATPPELDDTRLTWRLELKPS